MKTKANRILWVREDVATYLGFLEDEGVDVYSFDTLLDVADEYLDFLNDADECLDNIRHCLARAIAALEVPLAGMEDDEDVKQAFREIGHALEAGDSLRKIIAEVDP